MADDVGPLSTRYMLLLIIRRSLGQFLQLHFRMRISLLATMELPRIAVVPTRMTKVSTRTSRPIPNQKWAKNLTQITRVAVQIVMRRWEMQTVMLGKLLQLLLLLLLLLLCQNAPRRSRKRPNDGPANHLSRRAWRIRSGEDPAVLPMHLYRFTVYRLGRMRFFVFSMID